MNRAKAIRLKFYELLNGNLTYAASPVPVHDSILEDNDNKIYVLLTEQTATMDLNNCMNVWDCDVNIEIYSKQHQTVSKDVVDDIEEQIETLINNALGAGTQTNGWQLINVYLASSDNQAFELSPTKSIVSKLMTYRLRATKL